MRKIKSYFLAFILFFITQANAQEKKVYKIHTVAFYNLENLFDPIDDPTKFDEASPIMELNTNREEVYKKKVGNMARVLADI
ncbi:MAG TPA: endonuclease/exonuclease/phosphatase family protein, partial [Mariniflexile sp.]